MKVAQDNHIHPSHEVDYITKLLVVCRACGHADIVNEAGVAGWGNLDGQCAADIKAEGD